MEIQLLSSRPATCTALLLPYRKGEVDFAHIRKVTALTGKPDFTGDFREILPIYHPGKQLKIFLLGLGDAGDLPKAAQAFRSLAFTHYKKWQSELVVDLSHLPQEMAFQAALGLGLATYQAGRFKTDQKPSHPFHTSDFRLSIIHPDTEAAEQAERGRLTADTQMHMMQLVDSPGNHKTPQDLAQYALQSAQTYGYSARVMELEELKQAGFEALLAVGQGSETPPVLIDLQYRSPLAAGDRPQLGLVGKGITFDTGGLSIKGSTNMHYMKSDMGGAAAVIGAIELAARLQLPIHVRAIIPSAENSVDARSIRPGDVIGSWSGKTIEVIDTDAEGRLVLADGLAYLQQTYQPETVIDLATLTGSCVATLGYAAAGLFTNNEDLAGLLSEAGFRTHERVWRLPLWEDYEDDLQSDVADLRNYSGKPIAGAITAAKFLEAFIPDHDRWAHLDIAGVAFGDSPFTKMKAATGYGIRLLIAFMQTLAQNEAVLQR